jgi:DNA repair protein RadD
MYGRFIADLRAVNPDMRLVGLTATPYRLSTGRLDEGDDRLFDKTVYTYGIADGVRDGYLARLVTKATETLLDVSGVQKRGGEYVESQLQAAVDKEAVTRRAIEETIAYGHSRRSWLAFCSGIDHAYHVRDEIRRRGFSCETVIGTTPTAERARILDDFKAGKLRCVTNNSVLTTGFNAPGVDMIIALRPTASAGLYVQMMGRGTRNAPGKDNALVLDFAGLIRTHGPVDAVKARMPGKGDGVAPVKECPNCHSLIHASLRECPDCGHYFEPNGETKLTTRASSLAIMQSAPAQWLRVTERTFAPHYKPEKPTSVLTKFKCGFVVHKAWYCPAHDGRARSRADKFWMDHGGKMPVPRSADEWLSRADELRATDEISVKPDGKYFAVEGARAARLEMAAE